MSDSRNWRELIDDLFAFKKDKQRLATEKSPLEPDDLWNAPYEFQVYSIKKYLSTTDSYSFTFNRYFSHLIDLIPDEYLPQIAEAAILAAESGAPPETVSNVIKQISEQQVEALHPYLDRLFDSIMVADMHSKVRRAWRGASHFDKLKAILADKQYAAVAKLSAWECLLESRNPDAIRYAIAEAEAGNVHHVAGLQGYLHWVGYDWDGSNLRQLYGDTVYHLIFPQDYLKHIRRLKHPTYHLNTSNALRFAFGGVTTNACWICQRPLHHVITLTTELTGLPIHSRQSVELVTCLSCPDYDTDGFFYQHDDSGKAESIPQGQPSRTLDMNSQGFMLTEVALVQTPPRWQWQQEGNLNRISGNSMWVQASDYPKCIRCGERMMCLMQLMSGLPEADGTEQMWSDMGMGYFYWCDRCAISRFASQSY